MVRKIRYYVCVCFASHRKSRQYVFKAVRINSPKCSFVGVARWYDFTNFIPPKNAQQYDMLQYRNVSSIGLLSFGHIPSGTWTGQPSPTTLTLTGFTRNAKYAVYSCKWSNLVWSSSSSLAIYFYVLPLCGLQLPLRKKPSLSFWHWENDRIFLTKCLFENF